MGLLNRKDKNKRKRGQLGIGLADHVASPRHTADQDAPEPERVTRPDEEAEVAVHQLKEPPQAEGER